MGAFYFILEMPGSRGVEYARPPPSRVTLKLPLWGPPSAVSPGTPREVASEAWRSHSKAHSHPGATRVGTWVYEFYTSPLIETNGPGLSKWV